jgi:DNA replication protein DnaC
MIKNYNKLSILDKMIYDSQVEICKTCPGIDKCKQDLIGIIPIITKSYLTNEWGLSGTECGKQRGNCYSHLDIKSYVDIYKNDNRNNIVDHLLKCKGGFIYGDGGHGKTYTLGYIANEFNKKGKNIYFDLANNITRNVFDFKTRQETLDNCIKAEILIIDDFGGESYMAVNGFHTVYDCWIPILKNRIDNGKITYISSNYNLNSLSDRLEKATDKITATIIMDRIKTIGVINFKDKNYRM